MAQLFFTLLGPTSAAYGTRSPSSGLSWTGEVAGHGKVTLYGDASSIEEQIFALNPSLAKDYTPTSQFMSNTPPGYKASEVFDAGNSTYYYKSPDRMAARNDINGAMKLSDFFGRMDWYCSTLATGDVNELRELVSRVGAPGGQNPENAMWSIAGIPGGTNCERLACAGTKGNPGSTAVYWCNDTGKMVTTEAANLAAVAASIASGHRAFNFAGCCLQSQKDGDHHQISGQMHLGNGTNINVGYGECSKFKYFSRPDQYGYPGDLGYCIWSTTRREKEPHKQTWTLIAKVWTHIRDHSGGFDSTIQFAAAAIEETDLTQPDLWLSTYNVALVRDNNGSVTLQQRHAPTAIPASIPQSIYEKMLLHIIDDSVPNSYL